MQYVKTILAVLAGLAMGITLIFFGERVISGLYPFPQGIDMTNMESIKQALKTMPVSSFLLILVNYMVASFFAGMVATVASLRVTPRPALIVGAILTAGGISNDVMVPNPIWFAIVSILVYIPLAYCGYLLTRKKTAN